MSHLDPSSLASYNSLVDPHLASYFSNDRIRSHLKRAGLVTRHGEIVSDSEYRTRLALREHRKHVQHVLAENIVSRAIDLERERQAEVRRVYETVSKKALVDNIKGKRRGSGALSGLLNNSADMGLLAIDSSRPQSRSRSANNQPNDMHNEQHRVPRIQSANVTRDDERDIYSSKTSNGRRVRRLKLSKRNRSSKRSADSPTRTLESNPCQITMVYYGPHTKVDFDHLVFEPMDEVIVMQQHCGGENISVYKDHLRPGDEFVFNSRRHADYPFGLSLYVKGFIDSRISTCCEYKHRRGVKLGGDRGHFAIKSVKGSKPCIKCRFEKQARLKKYARSSKNKENDTEKSIIIPLPASDEPKMRQTPVKISVRPPSVTNDNYSDDFDGSEQKKRSVRDGDSTSSSARPSHTNEKDSTRKISKRLSPIAGEKPARKSSWTEDESTRDESSKKTWQMTFHTSDIRSGNFHIGKGHSAKHLTLKVSLMAKDETESYEIEMKQFAENVKSAKQYSFSTKFKDIGKPEQIRLKIQTRDDDDDNEDDVKWHLDHVELIDPKSQSHLIFPCKQPIELSHEQILRLSKKSSKDKSPRKDSVSTNGSRRSSATDDNHQPSPKAHQKSKITSLDRKHRRGSEEERKSKGSSSSDEDRKQTSKVDHKTKTSSSDNKDRHKTSKIDEKTKRSSDEETPRPPAKAQSKIKIWSSDDDTPESSPKVDRTAKSSSSNKNDSHKSPKVDQKVEASSGEETPRPSTKAQRKTKIESSDDDTPEPSSKVTRTEKTSSSNDNNHQQSPKNDQKTKTSSNDSSRQQSPKVEQKDTSTTSKQSETKIDSARRTSSDNQSKQNEKAATARSDINEHNNQSPSRIATQRSGDDDLAVISHDKDSNVQKKETLKVQSKESDNESTPRNEKVQHTESDQKKDEPKISERKPTNDNTSKRSPSFQSMNDEEATYKTIFRQLDPDDKLSLGSPPPSPVLRPKTRRGRQDPNEQESIN